MYACSTASRCSNFPEIERKYEGHCKVAAKRLDANGGRSGYIGLAAPVAFELRWGNLGPKKAKWSLGFMGQLIDVGALPSYRMKASNNSLKSEPDVGFAQVFWPGGYLVLGIPRVSLMLGVGGNFAPRLRKVGETKTKNATRLVFLLEVDIPMFVFK